MKIDYSLLGRRIADIRTGKGLTQEKLSEMAGITNNYLSNIERSRSIPSLETLMSLCAALDTTPNHILIGTDDSKPEYLLTDITDLLNECTPRERRIVFSFVDILINNRV